MITIFLTLYFPPKNICDINRIVSSQQLYLNSIFLRSKKNLDGRDSLILSVLFQMRLTTHGSHQYFWHPLGQCANHLHL